MPTQLEIRQIKWNANTALLQARKRAAHTELPEELAQEALALLADGEYDYIHSHYYSALQFAIEVHEIIDNAEEA